MKNKYGLVANNRVDINPDQSRERISVNAYYKANKEILKPVMA